MADDIFRNAGYEITAPANNAAAVTPSDSTLLDPPCRGLYIGGAGDVAVDTVGGQTEVVFVGALAGSILPVRATRVRSTNTDATNIVALW